MQVSDRSPRRRSAGEANFRRGSAPTAPTAPTAPARSAASQGGRASTLAGRNAPSPRRLSGKSPRAAGNNRRGSAPDQSMKRGSTFPEQEAPGNAQSEAHQWKPLQKGMPAGNFAGLSQSFEDKIYRRNVYSLARTKCQKIRAQEEAAASLAPPDEDTVAELPEISSPAEKAPVKRRLSFMEAAQAVSSGVRHVGIAKRTAEAFWLSAAEKRIREKLATRTREVLRLHDWEQYHDDLAGFAEELRVLREPHPRDEKLIALEGELHRAQELVVLQKGCAVKCRSMTKSLCSRKALLAPETRWNRLLKSIAFIDKLESGMEELLTVMGSFAEGIPRRAKVKDDSGDPELAGTDSAAPGSQGTNKDEQEKLLSCIPPEKVRELAKKLLSARDTSNSELTEICKQDLMSFGVPEADIAKTIQALSSHEWQQRAREGMKDIMRESRKDMKKLANLAEEIKKTMRDYEGKDLARSTSSCSFSSSSSGGGSSDSSSFGSNSSANEQVQSQPRKSTIILSIDVNLANASRDSKGEKTASVESKGLSPRPSPRLTRRPSDLLTELREKCTDKFQHNSQAQAQAQSTVKRKSLKDAVGSPQPESPKNARMRGSFQGTEGLQLARQLKEKVEAKVQEAKAQEAKVHEASTSAKAHEAKGHEASTHEMADSIRHTLHLEDSVDNTSAAEQQRDTVIAQLNHRRHTVAVAEIPRLPPKATEGRQPSREAEVESDDSESSKSEENEQLERTTKPKDYDQEAVTEGELQWRHAERIAKRVQLGIQSPQRKRSLKRRMTTHGNIDFNAVLDTPQHERRRRKSRTLNLQNLQSIGRDSDDIARDIPEDLKSNLNPLGSALLELQQRVRKRWGGVSAAVKSIAVSEACDDHSTGERIPIRIFHAELTEQDYNRSLAEVCVLFNALHVRCDEESAITASDFLRLQDVAAWFRATGPTAQRADVMLRTLEMHRRIMNLLSESELALAEVFIAKKLFEANGSHRSSNDKLGNIGPQLADVLEGIHGTLRSSVGESALAAACASRVGLHVLVDIINIPELSAKIKALVIAILSQAIAKCGGDGFAARPTAPTPICGESGPVAFSKSQTGMRFVRNTLVNMRRGAYGSKMTRIPTPPDFFVDQGPSEFENLLVAEVWRPLFAILDPEGHHASGQTTEKDDGALHHRSLHHSHTIDSLEPLDRSLLTPLLALLRQAHVPTTAIGSHVTTLVPHVLAALRKLHTAGAQAVQRGTAEDSGNLEQDLEESPEMTAVIALRDLADLAEGLEFNAGHAKEKDIHALAAMFGGCRILADCLQALAPPLLTEDSLVEYSPEAYDFVQYATGMLNLWKRERSRLLSRWPARRRAPLELAKMEALTRTIVDVTKSGADMRWQKLVPLSFQAPAVPHSPPWTSMLEAAHMPAVQPGAAGSLEHRLISWAAQHSFHMPHAHRRPREMGEQRPERSVGERLLAE